jgi:TnpA family transposase
MVHRPVLTEKQRNHLLALPSDEETLLQNYILSDDDLAHICRRLKPANQLGFALQLCAFRYPGRYLQKGELIPNHMLSFIAAQLGVSENAALEYATRVETRRQHTEKLCQIYGFTPFVKTDRAEFKNWLTQTSIETRNNAELAELFVRECRKRQIILPGITVIERLCADARVAAERAIVGKIASMIDERIKRHLHALLDETVDGRLTVYGWLKRFETGHNSADVNRLLDRLEYLKELDIPDSLLNGIPPHRILWLRQQGEAYYADSLRDIHEERRLAILATCVIEWKAMLTDAILETHDRIVGRIYNDAKRMRDDQLVDQEKLTNKTLTSFIALSQKLLNGYAKNVAVSDVIQDTEALETLMDTAAMLTKKLESDPLEYVVSGYGKFRRYTQRMLEDITFEGNEAAQLLLEAISILKKLNYSDSGQEHNLPVDFVNAKWSKRLGKAPERKLWETAVLFSIRDNLRSRDIWVRDSRGYQDTRQQLLPLKQAQQTLSLSIPLQPESWLAERTCLLEHQIKQVSRMIRQGSLPNSYIDKGKIRVNRLDRQIPEGMDQLTLELYKQMPEASITDILREVDQDTGFTDSFTHIHTGSPCPDKVGLLNVILAGGINMGLKKMALCSSSHTSFWSLMRLSSWFVTSEAMTDALATVIEQHSNLPLSELWGDGTTSASDGQFMVTGGTGEAMNVVNAKYGTVPGIKAYTHISDQYGPFALKTIPATAHEAPYILDGLTMNDNGKRIKEHYADTGGFTDHVFAMCALLGYQFAPRLRNLSSLRLYGVEGITIPKAMKELINAKANLTCIQQQWPDILRMIASITTHKIVPSDMLRQLSSFPRQNELAIALREIGRIERTIFILTWIGSVALQRRTQMGLNKGEAHHALKRALNFNRRGEITDRFSENQHLRMMHLNLLAAIIIYWNTKHLGRIIYDRKQQGQHIPPEQLAHLSPLGWEHIILTGFYKW